MKSLEELLGDKLLDISQYLLSKIIKPDISIENICNLDEKAIDKLKQNYGIEGIILDVDDTIRKEMQEIPKCNKDWISSLNGKLKVVILSNGIDKNIEEYFKKQGIDYIGFAHKPLKSNFLKACAQMGLTPDKVLVVGDSIFSDIYGGKKLNMKTILVKNVSDVER